MNREPKHRDIIWTRNSTTQRVEAEEQQQRKSPNHRHRHKRKKSRRRRRQKKKKDEAPVEPQYDSFFDVPADNGNLNGNSNENANGMNTNQAAQPSGDLLSGDWWQQNEEDPFGTGQEDDEFGWFQSGDTVQVEESGVGEDGGAFGFGNEEDFVNDDDKKEELDADGWMTSLTKMDNVLDGSVQKKDPNKRNVKGRSMAAMAASNPMPTSFGTDDFFSSNSGTNTNQSNSASSDFDPFGMNSNNTSNANNMINGTASNITSLYNTNGAPQQQTMYGNATFGYQGKSLSSAYNTDPFAGIGSGSGMPQPANYVPRKKQDDPFAQFGNMKK